MKSSLSLLAIFLSLSTALPAFQKKESRKSSTANTKKTEWVINNAYRLAVTVAPGSAKRHQTPVGLDLNFNEILKARGIVGRLDKNSIRIVRFNPVSGREHWNALGAEVSD